MTRVIKFRGWHFSRKTMFSCEEMTKDQMAILPDGRFANINGTHTSMTRIFSHEEFLPLQFTGLLDKNGKEIFEGDILRLERGDGCHVYDMADPDPDTRIIQYNEHGAPALMRLNGEPQGSGLTWCKSNAEQCFVVIGNIHQNADLLPPSSTGAD